MMRESTKAKIEEIRACAVAGMTRAETAEKFGMSLVAISAYGRRFGMPFRRDGMGIRDTEQAEAMAAMYANGVTLKKIGDLYGVTRERVRQIITKTHGMTRTSGGQSVSARRRADRKHADRDARCLRRYGCTFAEWRALADNKDAGEKKPTIAFTRQKTSAKQRGIEWNLTLSEWWAIWQASGKWSERGRGHGYMMCRFADAGAYEIGNVYIATGIHNGKVQPNNPYRIGHPEHDRVVSELQRRLKEAA